jgi:hypothetical protein
VDTDYDFLAAVTGRAAALLDSESPYSVGIELLSLGGLSVGNPALDEIAVPLMLIWGSLTDALDGPGADDPAMVAWGLDGMRRAASEWLALDKDDPEALCHYLDRWVYEECGYQRTTNIPDR